MTGLGEVCGWPGPGLVPVLLLGAAALFVLRFPARRREATRGLAGVAGPLAFYLVARAAGCLVPTDLRAAAGPWWSTVLLLLLSVAGARLLVWIFLDLLLPRRTSLGTPAIVKDVATAALVLAAAFLVLRATLKVDLASLVATSAVLTVVIGLALQETLSNLFAGLSIQMEAPFGLGNWISFDSHTGRVEAVNWRSTTVRTLMGDQVTIPNSLLAKSAVTNYSRPTPLHGLTVSVGLPYGLPPNQAKEAILSAFADYPDVATVPPPEVRLVSCDDFSLGYEARFFITDFARHPSIRSEVMTRIWYHLKRNGITIPFPIRDVNVRQVTPAQETEARFVEERQVADALRGVDILEPLSDKEIASLAARVRTYPAHAGEAIIREGDPGDSCFIVRCGKAEVSVAPHGERRLLTTLGPGSVFGEMSLLTGEPRSATVTALSDVELIEVGKAAFARVLAANPDIAASLGNLLARRQAERTSRLAQPGAAAHDEGSAARILNRIRVFFGL